MVVRWWVSHVFRGRNWHRILCRYVLRLDLTIPNSLIWLPYYNIVITRFRTIHIWLTNLWRQLFMSCIKSWPYMSTYDAWYIILMVVKKHLCLHPDITSNIKISCDLNIWCTVSKFDPGCQNMMQGAKMWNLTSNEIGHHLHRSWRISFLRPMLQLCKNQIVTVFHFFQWHLCPRRYVGD